MRFLFCIQNQKLEKIYLSSNPLLSGRAQSFNSAALQQTWSLAPQANQVVFVTIWIDAMGIKVR